MQWMLPNQRSQGIAFSATLALAARAKELAASGVDVISMAVGEPDFPAPQAAQDAGEAAIRSGAVGYTPVAGKPSLRRVIAEHLTHTRGVLFEPSEVTVCHSAKHALSGTLLTLVEPGDEVLILLPAWNSYVELVKYAGAVPVDVAPRKDCGPDFDAIAAAMTPRTKGVMLNSPSNPSGYVWTEAEIRELVELTKSSGAWLLSDEIYRRLVYEGEPNFSPATVSPEARARTVVVDGASKTFAMTGYRIGYLAAPQPIAKAVAALNSQLTGCPNAVSQAAFEAALQSEPPEVEVMTSEFNRRRKILIDGLEALGLKTPWPRGAFYAFPNVAKFLDERGSAGFSEDLLEDQALAIVPGDVFGMDTHVRFSYATSIENIEGAITRLAAFLDGRK
jgi:aspartate aminotransferase